MYILYNIYLHLNTHAHCSQCNPKCHPIETMDCTRSLHFGGPAALRVFDIIFGARDCKFGNLNRIK